MTELQELRSKYHQFIDRVAEDDRNSGYQMYNDGVWKRCHELIDSAYTKYGIEAALLSLPDLFHGASFDTV